MLELMVGLVVATIAVVAVPLLVLAVVVGLVACLVILPFKILGGLFHVTLWGAGLVVKLILGALALVAGVVIALLALLSLPILPLALLGVLLYLLIRALSPSRAAPRPA